MSVIYTTDNLIENVRLFAHIPDADSTFTPENILKIATREMQTPIVKQILSSRGNYYLTYKDYEINAAGLYLIPQLAIAGALYQVQMVQNTTIIPVNLIEPAEQFTTNSSTTTSYGYFFVGNYVQILPIPNLGVVRLWYFLRPGKLIQTTEASKILMVTDNVYSVNIVPDTITVGSYVDFVGSASPYNVYGLSKLVTDITGTDITVESAIDDVEVGDYICPTGTSVTPQVPTEYQVALEQRCVVKIYELQGYLDKMKAAKAQLAEYEADTLALVTPRVQSQSKIINPVNGSFWSGNSNRFGNYPAGRNV
jgi:hypothetical protein